MPRDIRVGDKVRLLPLGGDGLMAVFVGCIGIIEDMDSQRKLAWVADVGVWWPVSKLEPLDAPSAWTKTSEGKPDVGVWVLSLYIEAVRGTDYAPYAVLRLGADGQWHEDPEHNGDTFLEPNYWQPLPAPPEVSK